MKTVKPTQRAKPKIVYVIVYFWLLLEIMYLISFC